MKASTTAVLLACGMVTSLAASAYKYTDKQGRRFECHNERVTSTTTSEDHTTVGTLGGAAVGGLVGNQFGKGSGNTAATVGGAVVGGLIGHNQTKPKTKSVVRTEKHCTQLN